ncbi:calcineurin-binding protein cabin-1-like isoform X2 [Toxorhynchites rutilus septentrionalis]|uniref:calcineurin-binding protein cabin-1-like isoform X2 n=1 Tax=Toxorhynchites rutilus septentrionalis TaxID=329112 RepID=UPI00247AF377|nr:calcineurin-binding protein cabin-1-like isoform X2 [Toxorhynchites rutilus septentrionalis]
MLPIRALNEDFEDSCSSVEADPKVTGEAEETIIVTEYLRALRFQNANQTNDALIIFLELLETEKLSKALSKSKDNKIVMVKYNCYRNIGFIYQEKCEEKKALEYLIKAIELDDTDVSTMYSLAKLAFNTGQTHVARMYYEKCFELNPNYWPCLDGLLQVYCASENIIEIFHWAVHCFNKDNQYKRTTDAFAEMHRKFTSTLPFLEEMYAFPLKGHVHALTFGGKTNSNFGIHDDLTGSEHAQTMEYEPFELQTVDWVVLGKMILQLCNSIENSHQDFLRMLKLSSSKSQCESSKPESNNDKTSSFVSNQIIEGESNNQKQPDNVADCETKNRRRGSELKILEQWGWHKNRRSSRKKSIHEAIDPIESTADRFLRRSLGQYFLESFEDELSPFSGKVYENRDDICNHHIMLKNPECSLSYFCDTSKHGLETLISELQNCEFDAYGLLYRYLQHLSFYWNEYIPSEIRTVYLDLFNSFKTHNSIQYWNQLSNSEISTLYRMSLFFLELEFDRVEKVTVDYGESELDDEFFNFLNNLQLCGSHLPEEDYFLYQCRYHWLNCIVSLFKNDLQSAMNRLEQIEKLIAQNSKESETISNQQLRKIYDSDYIHNSIILLRRRICLGCVRNMYGERNYPELVAILKDSLINVTGTQSNDNSILSVPTQIELLLECLWNMADFTDCIKWAEKSLKYTTDIFTLHPHDANHQQKYGKTINFILDYIISIIKEGSIDILGLESVSRMVQTMHKILTVQLDPSDKYQSHQYTVQCWKIWEVVYYLLERQDDRNMIYRKNCWIVNDVSSNGIEDESMLNSVMMFFIAHELLGRRQWCSKENNELLFMMLDVIVPKLRSPLFEAYRDIINECLEQATYCLYGYPPRKGRTRHIQDHEATSSQLTWEKAIQLFDIYRPDILPEFNSYKIDSISADMEALLQHILLIMPVNCDVTQHTTTITNFINGDETAILRAYRKDVLPFSISSIYYLLADYYFKCRDFTKAIKYYVMDLAIEPIRFDSWAGISLSKASKCETTLNSTETIRFETFIRETKSTMRCFEQCIMLNELHLQLWVEYGSFAYNVHSYCSRALKSRNQSNSIEIQRNDYLNIAFESFNKVNIEPTNGILKEDHFGRGDAGIHEDEKWLYHYMLGKIAEKKKEQPVIYLTHYLKSAKFLYDCNATYPIKVNHSNPSHLSIEALELFYRTNAAIIKYLEQHPSVCNQIAGLLKKILKELATCPFAFNRAKINDAAFKRKLTEQNNDIVVDKQTKNNTGHLEKEKEEKGKADRNSHTKNEKESIAFDNFDNMMEINVECHRNDEKCLTRRISQEDTPLSNTTTATISIGTSSVSSDSDSPNSALDFSSDSETESTTDDEGPLSSDDRDLMFKDCIKNLEECITRFPEHYKSVYRLAYHYLNTSGSHKSIERCRELLLGVYKTTLGNQINGLFTERKNNNFFNGIWRIPSPDIDRPGSFASHLSKCVIVLIDVLKLSYEHETLLELSLQLYRSPDVDKKYLNDADREKLFEVAVSCCIEVYQQMLEKNVQNNDDNEMLNLMVSIFKAYRKTIKHMQIKERMFSTILVHLYKTYIQGKAELPNNANILDLAIKLCTYEINYRKTTEKISSMNKCIPATVETATTIVTPMQPISASYIPGLTKSRKVNVNKHQPSTPTILTPEIAAPTSYSKYVPTGPSTIVSSSLPGLTITPVNVLNVIQAEISASSSTCHGLTSAFSPSKSNLSGGFGSSISVSEIPKMYLNAFSTISPNNVSIDGKKKSSQ